MGLPVVWHLGLGSCNKISSKCSQSYNPLQTKIETKPDKPVVAWDTSLRGTINAGFSSTSKERDEPKIIQPNVISHWVGDIQWYHSSLLGFQNYLDGSKNHIYFMISAGLGFWQCKNAKFFNLLMCEEPSLYSHNFKQISKMSHVHSLSANFVTKLSMTSFTSNLWI